MTYPDADVMVIPGGNGLKEAAMFITHQNVAIRSDTSSLTCSGVKSNPHYQCMHVEMVC